MAVGKQSPCLYLSPQAFLFPVFFFSPLILLRWGEWVSVWVGVWLLPLVNSQRKPEGFSSTRSALSRPVKSAGICGAESELLNVLSPPYNDEEKDFVLTK